jgi:predicted O-linked N-acetylglucosamine transferase (SPINDLY family)
VLSTPGDSFARRVGASLLRAAAGRQPLLLAASLAEFEDLAVHLAWGHLRSRHSAPPAPLSALAQLRAELRPNGAAVAGPLFDTALFARHAERAYAAMWELHAAAVAPMHLVVAPLAEP